MQSQVSDRLIHSNRQPLPMAVATRYFHRTVSMRIVLGWLLVATAALLLTASRAGAQPADGPGTVGGSMIAAKQFMGVANRTGVIVRAGAGLGELTVTTLSKGDEVVVVGASGDYLRILPPQGTFCLVARARVNLRGDASASKRTGRIIENTSVRVGSTVNSSIDKSPARLSAGEEVTVIGENNIYYHIEPPKSVFFYVEKRDLAKSREVKVTGTTSGWRVGEVQPEPLSAPDADDAPADPADNANQEAPPIASEVELAEPPVTENGEESGDAALTGTADEAADTVADANPVLGGEDAAPVAPPTTQPVLLTEFQELDARYVGSAELPLNEQPLEELKNGYEGLLEKAKADPIASSIVPILEARLKTILLRQEAAQDLDAMQAMREELSQQQEALKIEQQELAERAAAKNVTVYRAVGQIQSSSLQIGGGSLFRLCDPGNGRTIIYLRAQGDAVGELARLLESFGGVNGEIMEDKNLSLKYINVTKATPVDKAEVLKSVAAEIVPPSLVQQDVDTQ